MKYWNHHFMSAVGMAIDYAHRCMAICIKIINRKHTKNQNLVWKKADPHLFLWARRTIFSMKICTFSLVWKRLWKPNEALLCWKQEKHPKSACLHFRSSELRQQRTSLKSIRWWTSGDSCICNSLHLNNVTDAGVTKPLFGLGAATEDTPAAGD